MKSSQKIIIATILSSTILSSAHALESDFFIQIGGGIANSKSENVTSASTTQVNSKSVKLGDSPVFELEAGFKLNQYFTTSLSLDYFSNFSKSSTVTIGANSYTGTIKDISYLGTFNLYVTPFTFNRFTPFIVGGIGYGRNDTKLTASGPNSSFTGSTIHTDNTIYKFGIGTKIAYDQAIAFDIRYQYMDLGTYKIGQSQYTSAKSKLKVNMFMVGVGYTF